MPYDNFDEMVAEWVRIGYQCLHPRDVPAAIERQEGELEEATREFEAALGRRRKRDGRLSQTLRTRMHRLNRMRKQIEYLRAYQEDHA